MVGSSVLRPSPIAESSSSWPMVGEWESLERSRVRRSARSLRDMVSKLGTFALTRWLHPKTWPERGRVILLLLLLDGWGSRVMGGQDGRTGRRRVDLVRVSDSKTNAVQAGPVKTEVSPLLLKLLEVGDRSIDMWIGGDRCIGCGMEMVQKINERSVEKDSGVFCSVTEEVSILACGANREI